jgi:phosphate uptake regulator
MHDIDEALESLLAVRNIERIARDLAKMPDQADVAVRYARDVIDAIERFVTYLSITSRTSITPN